MREGLASWKGCAVVVLAHLVGLLQLPQLVTADDEYVPIGARVGNTTPFLPIINVGLPKTGSTSLSLYARCLGLKDMHWMASMEHHQMACEGAHACARQGLPLLECFAEDGFSSFSQLDCENVNGGWPTKCYFPQITHLESLIMDYPNATFILPRRSPEHWVRSVIKWQRMDRRIAQCQIPLMGLPIDLPTPPKPDDALLDLDWQKQLMRFYNETNARAERILTRSKARWVALDLEDDFMSTAVKLASALGGSYKCWRMANHKN